MVSHRVASLTPNLKVGENEILTLDTRLFSEVLLTLRNCELDRERPFIFLTGVRKVTRNGSTTGSEQERSDCYRANVLKTGGSSRR